MNFTNEMKTVLGETIELEIREENNYEKVLE